MGAARDPRDRDGMTTRLLDRRTEAATATAPTVAIPRDRVADLVRVGALGVVIVWHSTFSLFHRHRDGTLSMPNPIGQYHGLWLLTWVLQVMPLFFIVSGSVNAGSWRRHRAAGGSAASFSTRRLVRFLPSLAALAALCGAAEVGSRLTGHGPLLAHHLVILVPLWTLALLLAATPLTPALDRAWQRYGTTVTVTLVGLAAISDVLRFRGRAGWAGDVSTALVWLLAYQLGWVYRSAIEMRVPKSRALGRNLTLIGLFGLVVTTNLGPYPRSMVATTTDPISNMAPTTMAIAALAVFQCGLLLMLRPRLAQWLSRDHVWNRVEWAGQWALPAYLLHMVAVVVLVLAGEWLGIRFIGEPTAWWWITRPVWLLATVAILVPILRAARLATLEVDAP